MVAKISSTTFLHQLHVTKTCSSTLRGACIEIIYMVFVVYSTRIKIIHVLTTNHLMFCIIIVFGGVFLCTKIYLLNEKFSQQDFITSRVFVSFEPLRNNFFLSFSNISWLNKVFKLLCYPIEPLITTYGSITCACFRTTKTPIHIRANRTKSLNECSIVIVYSFSLRV